MTGGALDGFAPLPPAVQLTDTPAVVAQRILAAAAAEKLEEHWRQQLPDTVLRSWRPWQRFGVTEGNVREVADAVRTALEGRWPA